jgi:hypothetical protein
MGQNINRTQTGRQAGRGRRNTCIHPASMLLLNRLQYREEGERNGNKAGT